MTTKKSTSTTNRLANEDKNVRIRLSEIGADKSSEARDNNIMPCCLLGFDEVCDLLKIGRSTLYDLINEQKLVAVKLARRTLFRPSDITNYINSLTNYKGGPNGF